MGEGTEAFEFSELVRLYCENSGVIKTLADRWRKESSELVRRINEGVIEYKDEWEFSLRNTFVGLKKRAWVQSGLEISFEMWFEPEKIGRRKLAFSIYVKDSELRKKVCAKIGKEIFEKFGRKPDNAEEWILGDFQMEVKGSYEDAIMNIIGRCIKFAPILERSIKETSA